MMNLLIRITITHGKPKPSPLEMDIWVGYYMAESKKTKSISMKKQYGTVAPVITQNIIIEIPILPKPKKTCRLSKII